MWMVGILKDCSVQCALVNISLTYSPRSILHVSDVISVTNILNIIKGRNRAQKHRKIIQFLKNVEGQYKDASLYSFTFLCKKMLNFWHNVTEGTTKEYQFQLTDGKFIGLLTFLTDINNHLD